MSQRLIRIVAPHFVAGAVAVDGKVTFFAPIISYMRGWGIDRVKNYCTKKGWGYDENLCGGEVSGKRAGQ
jgi:hypothetical protein